MKIEKCEYCRADQRRDAVRERDHIAEHREHSRLGFFRFFEEMHFAHDFGHACADARHEEQQCPHDDASCRSESDRDRARPGDEHPECQQFFLARDPVGEASERILQYDERREHDSKDDADIAPIEAELMQIQRTVDDHPCVEELQDEIGGDDRRKRPVCAYVSEGFPDTRFFIDDVFKCIESEYDQDQCHEYARQCSHVEQAESVLQYRDRDRGRQEPAQVQHSQKKSARMSHGGFLGKVFEEYVDREDDQTVGYEIQDECSEYQDPAAAKREHEQAKHIEQYEAAGAFLVAETVQEFRQF